MRVACLGGGPAGLYLAISLKRRQPGHEIVVVERNRPDDTFGWGVVLAMMPPAPRPFATRSFTGTTSLFTIAAA